MAMLVLHRSTAAGVLVQGCGFQFQRLGCLEHFGELRRVFYFNFLGS